MKVWPIVFVGLALICASQMWVGAQEPRMTEPTWSVGDMWTYAAEASGKREIVTIIVLAVRDKDYTIRTIQADGHYGVSSSPRESTPVGNLGGVGEISWPLSVGQHWSGYDSSTHAKIEATVDAFELVVVPAGTLGAFRIAVRICADAPQGACGSMRFWIAPQAKSLVKLEFGREPAIPENARGATFILVAYAVAP
jgi:hypothetical protein